MTRFLTFSIYVMNLTFSTLFLIFASHRFLYNFHN